jgi:hypothetical protein
MSFYQEGRKDGTFEDGNRDGCPPHSGEPIFLVRVEKEPANLAVGQTYRISDLELASRLSFFLWSTIPDDVLIIWPVREN